MSLSICPEVTRPKESGPMLEPLDAPSEVLLDPSSIGSDIPLVDPRML